MRPVVAVLVSVLFLSALSTTARADDGRVLKDITFATVGEKPLLLDVYLPTNLEKPPLLVWVHGGAWRSGSKDKMPLGEFVEAGYAVASVNYRLSPEAKFPAQVHDIKAAIRFLRAKANEYRYDGTKIGIVGSSAGGHLAALVGATNGHTELEGTVGDQLDQSSDVQAIIDLFGPTNFHTILQQSTPHGLSVRMPAFDLLLGGQPEDKPDLAMLASPVVHVDDRDPPLLILHGDQDPQVPINQSHELHGAYKQAKRPVEFIVVHGAAHGGDEFFDTERTALMLDFLKQHLASK